MAENQLMMINPFEALETGRKRAYAGYEAGQAAAQRETLNELYAQAADPMTGRIDRNRLMAGLAQRRMGAMIPQLEAEEAKLAEQRGKATQEETKALEGRMQYLKRMIPADPRLAPAWVEAAYADPIVGAQLSQLGSKEEVVAGIPQDPEGYASWVEGASMFADELSKRRTVTAENLLPYTQPLSPEVEAQKARIAGAGAARTTVALPAAETEYSKTVAKAAGEADIAALGAAENAAMALTKDYEAIDLLRRGEPSTGITADLELQFNRIKAAVGKDKEAAKKVKDTELLNALLGQDVFTNIQSLGIGARGLDTPAEREFLREVVSGTVALNRETLIKMAEIRANVKERAIDKFNKRVESGELDKFFQASGRPKRGIEKPEKPAAPPSPETGVTVNVPGRGPVVFPNKQAADAFKKAAGIK